MEYKKSLKFLRVCDCGTVAITEEALTLFEVDKGSKHGRRNRCKECAARKTRGDTPITHKVVTCTKCKVEYPEAETYRFFRLTKPRGDMVVGNFSRVCKACEEEENEYINIGGKLIPANLQELQRNSRITTKPKEVI